VETDGGRDVISLLISLRDVATWRRIPRPSQSLVSILLHPALSSDFIQIQIN